MWRADNKGMNSPTSLSNRFSALGIRGKLIGLVAAIATVSAVCLGFAVSGLLNARTKSHQSEATFKVFSAERNAYEGWLTDDDQSNMYAAFVALNNPSQHGLENTTWQQVLDGYQQANSNLSWLAAHSPTAAIRSKAAALQSDVATYNGFTQQVGRDGRRGNARAAVKGMTV